MAKMSSDYWAHEDTEAHACNRCETGVVRPSSGMYSVYIVDKRTAQNIANWVYLCDSCEREIGPLIDAMLSRKL